MHFAFLGTSGSVPSAVRDTTSIVVVVPEGSLLIDCGESPIQKLRRAGVGAARAWRRRRVEPRRRDELLSPTELA